MRYVRTPSQDQPCANFRPSRGSNEHAVWDNEHECLAPFDGTHPCADAGGTVSFCENCSRDHHSNGYQSCAARKETP